MSKTVNVSIRMDKDLKDKSDAVFSAMGLNTRTAVKMFLTQVVSDGKFPFTPRVNNVDTILAMQESNRGKNLIGPFDNVSDLWEALNDDA